MSSVRNATDGFKSFWLSICTNVTPDKPHGLLFYNPRPRSNRCLGECVLLILSDVQTQVLVEILLAAQVNPQLGVWVAEQNIFGGERDVRRLISN